KYTSGYFRNAPDNLLISPSHAARSNGPAVGASSMCVCGFSFEKSGDLSSSSARTAVFVRTFNSVGTARLYSRSVSSHSTRAMASASFPSRSEEHTSELQSPDHLACRLMLEKKKRLLPT